MREQKGKSQADSEAAEFSNCLSYFTLTKKKEIPVRFEVIEEGLLKFEMSTRHSSQHVFS